MEKKQITAFIKNPGQVPHLEIVDNTLEAFQELVGGYIETVRPFTDCLMIVNEEGRINGMQFNCWYLGESFFGPMVFVGFDDEGNFDDMPISFSEFMETNRSLWEQEVNA